MEDASDEEGGVFQELEEVLASLGDVLHAFSNLPYGVVRGIIDEGKCFLKVQGNPSKE